MSILNNISQINDKIAELCSKSGRNISEVKLIAVSKTKPIELIKQVYDAGIIDFGENRPQEAKEKSEQLSGLNINWHLIGQVQTNKVKYITKFCYLLHSLDRLELAEALQKRLEFENKKMDCLVQVNTSGEQTKSGIIPDNADEFLKQLQTCDRLNIKGLMTIAENTNDKIKVRDNFKSFKNIFEELKSKSFSNVEMKELSMGMSSDFEMAIEEGATMIRVGSSIFGNRNKA
ncbi:MAG TPA: YggS family pyridoxal phosphate-dependent enzyme [Alphaproteobacteria bacterium]|nr:YggS family pyridoxal phosphate-dependent enzyme [Alphaproteobacteria bacterium]